MVELHPDSPLAQQLQMTNRRTDEIRRELDRPSARDQLDAYGIPKKIRLEIPIHDQASLRRIADLLHGLATRLEVAGRRTDVAEKSALLDAVFDIKATNQKLAAGQKS